MPKVSACGWKSARDWTEQAGRDPEVEWCGPGDITERKGLEREILEISSREQRRIGHDLHDGVLPANWRPSPYRMDIPGDQLQEKGLPEFSESEKNRHAVA